MSKTIKLSLVAKKSIWPIIFSYLGVGIGFVNTLFLYPLFLETNEYGLFRFVLDFAVLICSFFNFGFNNSIVRFFPFFKDNNQAAFFKLIMKGLFVSVLVQAALLLVGFSVDKDFFFSSAIEAKEFSGVIIVIAVLMAFSNLVESGLRNYLKVAIPNLSTNVIQRILLVVSAFLVYLGIYDIQGFIYSIIGVFVIHFLILFFHFNASKEFNYIDKGKVPKTKKNEIIKYSSYVFMGSSSAILIAKLDSLMVGWELGVDYTAIYTVAFFIGVVVEMPRRVLSGVLMPLIAKAFKEEDNKELQKLYTKSATSQLLLGVLIFAIIWSNIDDLYVLIPKEEFVLGRNVVLIIGLAKLIDMAMGVNNELIAMSKYYRWNLFFIPFLAVLAIVSNKILIPIFNIEGAAIATIISISLYNIIRFLFLKVKMNLNPFEKNQILLVGLLIALASLNFVHLEWHPIINIGLKSVFIPAIFIPIVYKLNISTEINGMIDKVLSKISNR